MMSYHPVTRCSYCGTKSTNQPAGDGCHTCQRGIMQGAQEVPKEQDVGHSHDPAHLSALDDPRWREQINALKEVTVMIDAVLEINPSK